MMQKQPTGLILEKGISFVVPCYNEQEVLSDTVNRLHAAARATGQEYEIILVDDGSSDDSWQVICDESRRNPRVGGIRFSRNFGHQAAFVAGLARARGDEVMILDADLQDPPELIGPMREKLAEGFDVVYAKRLTRAGESRFKLAAAGLFYRILSFLAEIPIPANTGDFRLMSRRAVNALLQLPEGACFIRGMVAWIGFPQAEFLYHRDARAAGRPKYTLHKLIRLSLDGITSFSIRPLRLAVLASAGLIGSAFLLSAHVLIRWLITGGTVRGWTSLIITVLFVGGVQTFILGIIGEYIGTVFREVKKRPLYLVRDVITPQCPKVIA